MATKKKAATKKPAAKKEPKPIDVGSTVRLKSGGHLMTVEAMSADQAVCVWVDDRKQVQHATFKLPTLTIK